MIQILAYLALTLLALVLVLLPLWRPRQGLDPRAFDLEVYRDQLAELARDEERGLIEPAPARAARLEIERRILALAERAGAAVQPQPSARLAPLVSTALALFLPLFAGLLYLGLGSPNLSDQPLAARRLEQPPADAAQAEILAKIEQLQEHLKTTPDNLGVWLALGRARLQLGDSQAAVEALQKGMDLAPQDGAIEAELGEALIYAANGTVPPVAIQHFENALKKTPQEPRARYYLGLASAQAGKLDDAFAAWRAMLAEGPADAPWRMSVAEGIRTFAQQAGRDPAPILAGLPEANGLDRGMPQPSAADQAEMASLTADERDARIRSMVEGLAARLADNPEDVEGWLRLGRSRAVLGEPAQAQQAYEQALTRLPQGDARRATVEAELAQLARGGGAPAAPPGAAEATPPAAPAGAMPQPSAEQQAAIAALPPAEQSAQIRSMVDGLAAKLEQNPDDLEGWLQLARSRQVLGEPGPAKQAFEKALALAPSSPDVLKAYAGSLLGAKDPRTGTTAVGADAVALYERVVRVAPKDPEALWYLGLAAVQHDRLDQAAERWRAAAAALDPSHPNYAGIQASLQEIERKLAARAGKPATVTN